MVGSTLKPVEGQPLPADVVCVVRDQRLADVSACVAEGLAELAADGRFLHANGALFELLGRSPEALLQLSLADVTHPEDVAASRVACERVIAGGPPLAFTTRYVRGDGTAVRLTSRVARFASEGEGSHVALAVMSEATPRASALLRVPEEPLRWLLDNVRDYAIFLVDVAGHIEAWGGGARQVFGYDEAAIVGESIDLLFTPEDRASGAAFRELEQARVRGQVPDDRWHLRQSGERFWASGVLAALHDTDGALRGFVKICRDLTEQKRSDEWRDAELARETSARAAAEQATEAKDAFLATLSHELRTPLSAMLLWAKTLEEGHLGDRDRATGLAAIVRGGEAQRQLLEDLLDLSRMVAGTLRIDPQEVDLASVLRAAVETVGPMARAKSIKLTTALGDEGCVPVHGDSARLQQIVWNLLVNAVKFTPRGGNVELGLELVTKLARVSVRDTGRGIHPEFLPHVFERFRQGAGDATRPAAGLGLGLSIVRELVALHGGRVHVESDGEGRGATFTVELPRLARPSSILPPAPPLEPLPHGATRPLHGVVVLLVEDDPETQQVLVWLLRTAGAEVTATASASTALASFSERWPDVLVSDIGLQGEDGYKLMSRVCTHAAAHGRPVPAALALTAYARAEDRERALSVGFAAYAAKPIDPQPLLETVTALARRSRSVALLTT